MSLTNPFIAAQQRTTQTLKPPNPSGTNMEATHGSDQQTRTPGPIIAQHPVSEARSSGTQPGGSSSSPVVQQAVMSGSTCPPCNSTREVRNTGVQIRGPLFSHVAPVVAAPVEATTSVPRSSFSLRMMLTHSLRRYIISLLWECWISNSHTTNALLSSHISRIM